MAAEALRCEHVPINIVHLPDMKQKEEAAETEARW